MLTLATSLLTVGVVGVGLYHRMGAASVVAGSNLALLGTSATIVSGAFYSMLLLAMFGPTELFIRRAARPASRTTSEGDDQESSDWNVGNSLMRVVAMVAPLLTGVLQGLVEIK